MSDFDHEETKKSCRKRRRVYNNNNMRHGMGPSIFLLLVSGGMQQWSTRANDNVKMRTWEQTGASVLSLEPPILLFPAFLDHDEREFLVELGKPNMVDGRTAGKPGVALRTSSTHFLTKEQSSLDVTKRIIDRIVKAFKSVPHKSDVIALEKDWQLETFQVQQYEEGDFYQPHFDYSEAADTMNFRIGTFLVYLRTPEKGGETIFPLVEKRRAGAAAWPPYAVGNLSKRSCSGAILCDEEGLRQNRAMPMCCCEEMLKVKAKAGDALLFWPRLLNGSSDGRTWHGSCPILSNGSAKWTGQQWIHSREIGQLIGVNEGYGYQNRRKRKRRRKRQRKRQRKVEKTSGEL